MNLVRRGSTRRAGSRGAKREPRSQRCELSIAMLVGVRDDSVDRAWRRRLPAVAAAAGAPEACVLNKLSAGVGGLCGASSQHVRQPTVYALLRK